MPSSVSFIGLIYSAIGSRLVKNSSDFLLSSFDYATFAYSFWFCGSGRLLLSLYLSSSCCITMGGVICETFSVLLSSSSAVTGVVVCLADLLFISSSLCCLSNSSNKSLEATFFNFLCFLSFSLIVLLFGLLWECCVSVVLLASFAWYWNCNCFF